MQAYYIPSEDGALLFVKEHTVRIAVSYSDHIILGVCLAALKMPVGCRQEYSVAHCRGLILNGIGSTIKKKNRKELEEKLDKMLTFRS